MGNSAQRRLVRKLDIERFLSKIKPPSAPNVTLEQYTISESAAATMLQMAAFSYSDIEDKRVLDLGCGTGRLALGAAFLGAKWVVGVDIDRTSLCVALETSRASNLKGKVGWVIGDIESIRGKFDTVIQNPPFGVQTRGADRRFLRKALDVGCSVYSFHNHPRFDRQLMGMLRSGSGQPVIVEPDVFLKCYVEKLGGKVEAVFALPLTIPRIFEFHTKSKREIIVDLYVLRKR